MRYSPALDFFAALNSLPELQKLACALRYGDSVPMTYQQIADRLGNSRPAAYKLVRKGTARLRALGIDVNSLTTRAFAA